MTTTYDSHESVIGAKEAHLGRSTQKDFQAMVYTLIAYYASNKPDDSDWVVLPVTSFDAYFGTISFGRKYLQMIPGEILERPDSGFGICRYRVQEEYRI